MKIKELSLKISIAVVLGSISQNTNAALVNDTLLAINSGYVGCPVNTQCIYPTVQGSYFALDNNSDGTIQDDEKNVIEAGYDGGIIIGRTQLPGISIPESPAGAGIDNPWSFNGRVGWHETTSAVSVVNDLGIAKELDFSGWSVNWNGVRTTMGLDGFARITCETSACGNGESYTLHYSTMVYSPPQAFDGVTYALHLEGTISAVPVPAAVWLFGSGLVGLVGFARCKKE